jgi:hypothetical protein
LSRETGLCMQRAPDRIFSGTCARVGYRVTTQENVCIRFNYNMEPQSSCQAFNSLPFTDPSEAAPGEPTEAAMSQPAILFAMASPALRPLADA